MTDLESLLAAGLSQEEAEMVLANRAINEAVACLNLDTANSRLSRAQAALSKAHAKTGVAPVRVVGSDLEKSEPQDPEALERFYQNKGESPETRTRMKPDPDGWEDPP